MKNNNNTPGNSAKDLAKACEDGHSERIKELLAQQTNKDFNKQLIREADALLIACRKGHRECIQMLLTYGAQVNERYGDYIGRTPLHVACANNHVDCAQLLLDHGAMVDTKTKNYHDSIEDGRTPLHYASQAGAVECIRLLVAHGADMNARDNTWPKNMPPLLVALCAGKPKSVSVLAELGADLTGVLQEAGDAGRYADDQSKFDYCIKLLIQYGAT